MTHRAAPAVAILGAICVTLSLFLLPWVSSLSPEAANAQIDHMLSDARFRVLLDNSQIPELQQLRTVEDIYQLFKTPSLQQLLALLRDHPHLTAWDLWRNAPRLDAGLRWLLLMTLLFSLAAVVGILVAWGNQRGNEGKTMAMICGGATALSLISLLWYVPTIDTFGLTSDFGVTCLCWLFGSHAGSGIWVAILGLGLLTASAAISATASRVHNESEYASYL
jgi:hypothetical protein